MKTSLTPFDKLARWLVLMGMSRDEQGEAGSASRRTPKSSRAVVALLVSSLQRICQTKHIIV